MADNRDLIARLKQAFSRNKAIMAVDQTFDKNQGRMVRLHLLEGYQTSEGLGVAKEEFIRILVKQEPEDEMSQPPLQVETLERPLSISHKDRSGILGAIVYNKADNRRMILGSWHVMVPPGARPGDRIIQPGLNQGGDLERHWIASLPPRKRWLGPVRGSDAAVAFIEEDVCQIRGWQPPVRPLDPPQLITVEHLEKDFTLTKNGVFPSAGKLDGVGCYLCLGPGGERCLIEGFRIASTTPLSVPGDSGALWMLGNRPVGIHYDGGRDADGIHYALACHLKPALEKLRVSPRRIMLLRSA